MKEFCKIAVCIAIGIYAGRTLEAFRSPVPTCITDSAYEKIGFKCWTQSIDHHEYIVIRSSTGHVGLQHSFDCPCLDEYISGANQTGESEAKDDKTGVDP